MDNELVKNVTFKVKFSRDIPEQGGGEGTPAIDKLADGGSAVAAISKHYSKDTPCAIAYAWVSSDTETYTVSLPQCDKLALSDGTLQDTFAGGEVSIAPVSNQSWKYAVCMYSNEHAEQDVNAVYATGQATSLYEVCILDIKIQTINGLNGTNARLILSPDTIVNDVGNKCFQGYYFKTLPFDIKQISGSSSFYSCTSLQSVKLPSLTKISGNSVFSGCSSLKSVDLPSMTDISGSFLFLNCTSLQSVNFPSIKTINGQTFKNCNNLIDIRIKQDTDFSLNFSTWNPTEALLTTSTSLVDEGETFASNREKLLYNIRTYIAARLKDMTGLTAPTFSFGADLKTAITEDAETLAAFTSKNFNIA